MPAMMRQILNVMHAHRLTPRLKRDFAVWPAAGVSQCHASARPCQLLRYVVVALQSLPPKGKRMRLHAMNRTPPLLGSFTDIYHSQLLLGCIVQSGINGFEGCISKLTWPEWSKDDNTAAPGHAIQYNLYFTSMLPRNLSAAAWGSCGHIANFIASNEHLNALMCRSNWSQA